MIRMDREARPASCSRKCMTNCGSSRRPASPASGSSNQTLQPTALVHEAYLRVSGDRPAQEWDRRGHFFAAAALAMRRILVERARHYQRIKHGAGGEHVELDEAMLRTDPALDDLVAVDEALTQLEKMDPRKAKIVTLRYFAGLSVEETAKALDLSPATIKNEWAFARAWLYRQLGPPARRRPAVRRERPRHPLTPRKYFSPWPI